MNVGGITVFKNKLLNISLIIIISIAFLGVATYFLYQYIFPSKAALGDEFKEPSIEEILPLTVNVPKMNTNLGDSSVIVIEMTIQTDNQKAKDEADKRIFQIKDSINLYLKSLTSDNFSTEENINQFKEDLIIRLNSLLQEGKVVRIDITQLFVQ